MHGIQITFRNVPHSPELGARVRELAEKLDRLHPRILNCNVVLEAFRAPRRAPTYGATVRLRMDDREILASEVDEQDVRTALRWAFVSVRRELTQLVRAMEEAGHATNSLS
jgi:ribosome-associated translation inhibitor RaiA